MVIIEHDGSERPLLDLISESEIIISGTYRDTDDPINYVNEDEKSCLRPGALIIDEGVIVKDNILDFKTAKLFITTR